MELKYEEAVTKILSSNEILHLRRDEVFLPNTMYNLGEFLENSEPEPSPYEGKYIFIR